MEIKKGTFKREIAKIEIRDFEVSRIITNALLENGYDLSAKPAINNNQSQIGEQITIYRTEQR